MATGSANTWNRGIFNALRIAVHLFAAVHLSFGIFYDFKFVYPPVDHPAYHAVTSFGGKFRYLTILGAVGIWHLKHFRMYRFFHRHFNDSFCIHRFVKRFTIHCAC